MNWADPPKACMFMTETVHFEASLQNFSSKRMWNHVWSGLRCGTMFEADVALEPCLKRMWNHVWCGLRCGTMFGTMFEANVEPCVAWHISPEGYWKKMFIFIYLCVCIIGTCLYVNAHACFSKNNKRKRHFMRLVTACVAECVTLTVTLTVTVMVTVTITVTDTQYLHEATKTSGQFILVLKTTNLLTW